MTQFLFCLLLKKNFRIESFRRELLSELTYSDRKIHFQQTVSRRLNGD